MDDGSMKMVVSGNNGSKQVNNNIIQIHRFTWKKQNLIQADEKNLIQWSKYKVEK